MRVKIILLLLVIGLLGLNVCASRTETIPLRPGVAWWFGVINHGHLMPLKPGYSADLTADTYGNQAQPLLLSNFGDMVWCEDPPVIRISDDAIVIDSSGPIEHRRAGTTLRDAYLAASREHFPPSGKMPDPGLFLNPQYNTWIELMYNQNQEDIMKYARAIVANGFPPGILMIDDNWQEDYGRWDFNPRKFSDPKQMIDELHGLGFSVMLWICPFISPDSEVFRQLSEDGALLRDREARPAIIRWWNGASALLDFSSPAGVEWFRRQLSRLNEGYGVDGFKFDAGDAEYYRETISLGQVSANEHSRLFGSFGLEYPLNEYRAMWKMGGQPLAERLRDKEHNWGDMKKLIPHMLLSGLSGYPFSCPDMIGGGEFSSFLHGAVIDQELVVRSAQVHALMPMMQFSAAPWRVLDASHLEAVKRAVSTRAGFTDYIMELAREAAASNEPIVRSMEYVYPRQGYQTVADQFLLGDKVLVAPVLEKGTCSRLVKLPGGKWKSPSGEIFSGPREIEVPAPIEVLPYFVKVE